MKDKVLNNVIRVDDSLIIPGYIIKNYDKLNLEGLDLILMLYFIISPKMALGENGNLSGLSMKNITSM